MSGNPERRDDRRKQVWPPIIESLWWVKCGTAGKTTGETRDDAAGNSRISPIVVFNIANYRHFELEVKI